MSVLIFYTSFSETLLILRRTEQDMIKNVYRFCQIIVKLEFSRLIFEKYIYIKFPVVSCGRADWYEEDNGFFRNFTNN
jgi:hypothetical protein